MSAEAHRAAASQQSESAFMAALGVGEMMLLMSLLQLRIELLVTFATIGGC